MRKRVFTFLAALILLISISAPAHAELQDVHSLRHSVVRIVVGLEDPSGQLFLVDESGSLQQGYGLGSGFFVGIAGEDPQFLITNHHVVEDYLNYAEGKKLYTDDGTPFNMVIRVYYDSLESGDYDEASVDYYESVNDFAILHIAKPTSKRSPLPITVPTDEMVGRTAYSIGFPAAADNAASATTNWDENSATVNTGNVSRLFTETGTVTPYVQTTAVIHPGNSGGPLVFENGAAIGITTRYYDGSDSTANIYHAVDIKVVKTALERNNVPFELLEWPARTESVVTEATVTEPAVAEPAVTEPAVTEPAVTVTPDVSVTPVNNGFFSTIQNYSTWIIYGILGAAIIGVIILLIVLLRKPKKVVKTVPGPNLPTQPSARILVAVEGPLKGRRYTLDKGKSLYIGRDKGKCKVLFPDQTPGVSNIHCKISFDGKVATITDLKSSYGTFVGEKKLVPNSPTTLHRGLAIDIGSASNRFTLQ